jgi:hypothetical protein
MIMISHFLHAHERGPRLVLGLRQRKVPLEERRGMNTLVSKSMPIQGKVREQLGELVNKTIASA